MALANVERGEEGMESVKQTYETAKRVLGEDHPVTQNAANSLGLLLEGQKEYAEAEKIFRKLIAEATAQSRDGKDYPAGSGRFFNNLALVLQDQNKLAEAEIHFTDGPFAGLKLVGHIAELFGFSPPSHAGKGAGGLDA